MRINLNWKPTLTVCPECGHEQDFTERAACRACENHQGEEMACQWIDFIHDEIEPGLPDGVAIAFCHESEGDGYWIAVHVTLRRHMDGDEARLRAWIARTGKAEEGDIRAALSGCANPIDEEMSATAIETLIEEMREAASPEWVTGESRRAWQEEIEEAESALNAARAGKPVWRGEDEDGNFWWY